MLAISPKDKTADEIEFLEAMSRLRENPFFQKLVSAVEEKRQKYLDNLARGIAFNGSEHAEPVNQRVIDYKRGFWNGAVFAVSEFPKHGAKGWNKFVASVNNEESERS